MNRLRSAYQCEEWEDLFKQSRPMLNEKYYYLYKGEYKTIKQLIRETGLTRAQLNRIIYECDGSLDELIEEKISETDN